MNFTDGIAKDLHMTEEEKQTLLEGLIDNGFDKVPGYSLKDIGYAYLDECIATDVSSKDIYACTVNKKDDNEGVATAVGIFTPLALLLGIFVLPGRKEIHKKSKKLAQRPPSH